jgi:hypothetical protein
VLFIRENVMYVLTAICLQRHPNHLIKKLILKKYSNEEEDDAMPRRNFLNWIILKKKVSNKFIWTGQKLNIFNNEYLISR